MSKHPQIIYYLINNTPVRHLISLKLRTAVTTFDVNLLLVTELERPRNSMSAYSGASFTTMKRLFKLTRNV